MQRLLSSQFKLLAGRRGAPGDTVLRKELITAVEPQADRRIKFTISTGAVDRDNDAIAVSGWDLRGYQANPVVLWGHNDTELPIAKCITVGAEAGALKAVAEFVAPDMPVAGPKAEAIFQMLKSGFLSAVSVGFRPVEYSVAKDRTGDNDIFPGVNFTKQELLEFSVVSIPCNPQALIEPNQGSAIVATAPKSAKTGDKVVALVESLESRVLRESRRADGLERRALTAERRVAELEGQLGYLRSITGTWHQPL